MESIKEQIYDRVEKMYHQRVGISRIQATLAKTLNQEVPKELIYDIIEEIKQWKKQIAEIYDTIKYVSWTDEPSSKNKERADWWLKEIVADMGDDKKYDYFPETWHLVIYPEWQPKSLLLSTLEAIIESFSKDWKNMSAKQIMIDFQLTPKVRHYLKNTFNIYKDSTPFDPITLQSFGSEEDMEKSAKEKAERLTEWKMKRIYDDAERRTKELTFKKFAKANMWYDMFLEKFEQSLKKYKPRDFDSIKIPEIKNNDTKDVFITDAHIGKKWTDWIVIRFKKLTRDLLETPEKNINITFGWDLGECFLPYGEMHVGQRLGMEDIETSDLIMLIVDVFEQMLVSLYKEWKNVIFNWMNWNHDRFTEKKEFDPTRQPALLVYKFLQRVLENTTVKINLLKDKANVIKSWKIKYVFIHWDWLSPAEINRRAMAEIEDWLYTVIVSGDKHHYKMSELSDRVLRIQSPALAGQWRYDTSLWLSSLPWAVEFTNNSDWLIDFTVKRYK